MYVMQPVWQFLARIDGFEATALWVGAFTMVVMSGYFLDYIMQRQGFGLIYNSILVAVGLWLGLYVRFAYARPTVVPLADPLLTIAVILAVIVALITTLALVRNRFS